MESRDPIATGQIFVRRMLLLLAGVVALYLVLHAVVREPPPAATTACATGPVWSCFARLDELGALHLTSEGDADWYVGARTVQGVREQATANETAMDGLRRRVAGRAGAHLAPLLNDRAPVDTLRRQVGAGDYGAARATLESIVDELSTSSVEPKSLEIGELAEDLDRLAALRRAQLALAQRLVPPLSRPFFWTSPTLSMVEASFWATFGVLASLLVAASEALRADRALPGERWIAYAKLAYGPILALALVLAMVDGLLLVGRPGLRIWGLPLIGFLLGYASRHIVRVVDGVVERVLGVAGRVANGTAGPGFARRRELVDRLLEASRPGDWRALRAQAKELARQIVATEVDGRGRE